MIAITNSRIFDSVNKSIIENKVIIIKENLIEKIIPKEEFELKEYK